MKNPHIRHNDLKHFQRDKQKSPKCLATPFTVKGVKWEIHKHDNDINNPSCPHMHAIGKPWKLDLYTGEFYDERNGKRLGKIKEEDLIAIWQVRGIRKIIIAERAMYEELHRKDPLRFRALPPLLVLDEIKKIQNSKTNRVSKHKWYRSEAGLFSHSRAFLNRRPFRKLNKK